MSWWEPVALRGLDTCRAVVDEECYGETDGAGSLSPTVDASAAEFGEGVGLAHALWDLPEGCIRNTGNQLVQREEGVVAAHRNEVGVAVGGPRCVRRQLPFWEPVPMLIEQVAVCRACIAELI